MKKVIRSISIMESLDKNLKEDSEIRGLTVSANVSRILYEYYLNNPPRTTENLNLLPTIKHK